MIKTAPCFLAGAAVLAFLAGTVAFSASRALYGERALSGVQVGVVMPQEDRLARLALNLISSLDSVGSLCHFTQVEKEEGLSLLRGGGIAALLEIPPDVVEGILDGSNVPVTVTFAENAGLEAAVFRELGGCDKGQCLALERFGYFLGRWVYLMDAADDLGKDLKEGSFNPFAARLGLEGQRELTEEERKVADLFCNQALNATMAQMLPAFHLIDLEAFGPILENVVEKGLPQVQREILFLHVRDPKVRRELKKM